MVKQRCDDVIAQLASEDKEMGASGKIALISRPKAWRDASQQLLRQQKKNIKKLAALATTLISSQLVISLN